MSQTLTKKQVVEDILALHTWSAKALLLLRLLVDKPAPGHNIHQDLRDLESFPERLQDSYQAEWIAYIKRDLYQWAFRGEGSPQEQLNRYLEAQRQLASDTLPAQLSEGLKYLAFAHQVNSSENVSAMPSELKRWLKELLDI